MMTSSNENIFRVTGHLCGEFTGHRWLPRTKASDAELWCFLWSVYGWVNNREAGDFRRQHAHYDVTVMHTQNSPSQIHNIIIKCIPLLPHPPNMIITMWSLPTDHSHLTIIAYIAYIKCAHAFHLSYEDMEYNSKKMHPIRTLSYFAVVWYRVHMISETVPTGSR